MALPPLSYAVTALAREGFRSHAEALSSADTPEDLERECLAALQFARAKATRHALYAVALAMTEPTDPPT